MTILTPNEISIIYSESIFDIADTNRRHRKIVCPLPQHQHRNFTPSFSIFWGKDRWRWCCHGNCNKSGDVIDLVGYMQVPGYDPSNSTKLHRAISMLDAKQFDPAPPKPPKKKRRKSFSPTRWKEFYPPGQEVLEYAKMRGLSNETIEKYHIGQCIFDNGVVWMTLPIFEGNRLLGIKMRNTNPSSPLRYRCVTGSKAGLFNYDAINLTSDRVYLVKGEIAALVLLERGLLACAPTGGESMRLGQRYQQALGFADTVLIGDNDKDDEVRTETMKFAKRRAEVLGAKLVFPPEEYKDVDEWVLDDPGAINKLRDL